MEIFRRVLVFLRRKQLQESMAEEIRLHMEHRIDENIAAGMDPVEARYTAERKFGNITQIQEQAWLQRGWSWWDQSLRDVDFAIRSLRRTPVFTLVSLITLALVIGANTSAFTLLNRLMFFSPPFPETNRMVQITSVTPGSQTALTSPGDFCDIRDQAAAFEHTAAYTVYKWNVLAESGKPAEPCVAMFASADFFRVLGVSAALGRTFVIEDQNTWPAAVVLSHTYWKTHFSSDPDIIGRTVRFNGMMVPIIGVMPAVLDDPQIWGEKIDLWQLAPLKGKNAALRDRAWYSLVARLKSGVTLAQAQTELTALATRLAHDFPDTNKLREFHARSYPPDYLEDLTRRILSLIMALALTVLLIGCMNLANLQLVRATGRSREYAIRRALGATRGQLIRLMLTESLILSLAGGALGLLVAKWSNAYFATFFETPMPLDFRVLTFALVVSTFTGIAFGVMPAWLGSRTNLNKSLKQGGPGATSDRSRHWLRQTLIVGQIALALTLLSGAGYLVRGIQRIMNRDLHWQHANVLVGAIELPTASYGDETNARHQIFTEKFLTALRQLPGVDHAAISLTSPAYALNPGIGFMIEGQSPAPPGHEPEAIAEIVTPDYFDTYGLHLLQGRKFSETDRSGTVAVVLINRSMAEKYWPHQDPIGKRIKTTEPQLPGWYEIIGIVNDVTYGGDVAGQYPRYHLYMAWSQRSLRYITFSIHRTSDVRTLTDEVRKVLAAIEPDVAIIRLNTAEGIMADNLAGWLLVRRTLLELAGLGFFLSIAGIYGVVANLTTERTKEIGLRMALGAQRSDVIGLFLRNGITLTLTGTTLGLALAFGLEHFLNKKISMNMPGNDPWAVTMIAVALACTAAFACWLPARQAATLNPVDALRAE